MTDEHTLNINTKQFGKILDQVFNSSGNFWITKYDLENFLDIFKKHYWYELFLDMTGKYTRGFLTSLEII